MQFTCIGIVAEGADRTTAGIWPLIVDGLLTIATIELWKTETKAHSTGRWAAWLAFPTCYRDRAEHGGERVPRYFRQSAHVPHSLESSKSVSPTSRT